MLDTKREGAYETPAPLVTYCWDRVGELVGGRSALTVLEPSAGRGAFVAGLVGSSLRDTVQHVIAIEAHPERAAACRDTLYAHGIAGTVINQSVLDVTMPTVDVVVGNPPFVRFQYLGTSPGEGTTNLWGRVLRTSLTSLRPGGSFVMLLPGELLSGASSGPLRHWLLRQTTGLTVELIPPSAFPDVLTEILLVSGYRASSPRDQSTITVVDDIARFEHRVIADESTWTRWLLPPEALDAVTATTADAVVMPMGSLAQFNLGTTTGSNDFFCIDDSTRIENGLAPWARLHLARGRDARGLCFTSDDHNELAHRGKVAWMLDFAHGPNPMHVPSAHNYIEQGVANGINLRHKCRIRTHWYQLPNLSAAPLLLPKRVHRYPLLVENMAHAVTTDTIYRGRPTDGTLTAADLVVAFASTVTQLSAELEGRVLGGGALELVPSAIRRLLVLRAPDIGATLPALDLLARRRRPLDADDMVVDGADRILASRLGLDLDRLRVLRGARDRLLTRRLARPGAG